jgi:predicted ATPase
VAEHFAGAVWFVPLQDLSDPRLIPGEILETLRLPRAPQRDPLEQAVEFLNGLGAQPSVQTPNTPRSPAREGERGRHPSTTPSLQRSMPCLLVLDNLEHLLNEERRKGEDGAAVVKALLERVASLTLLVTSRQRLNLEGEREFPVPPLPVPAWSDGVGEWWRDEKPPLHHSSTPSLFLECPSVALFVDRAQAARPDFQLTERNAPAIAQLCCRLEGIPLAIELCAARALVMTSAQMLAQLEDRYAFLVSRKRDASERHRTLRAAVDWSYRLLSPKLQRFFARLSVFRGGWTAEAAEAVCEEAQTLEYLAQLRECSLVLSDETALGMRFRMLEMLREFGWERLSAEEQTDVSRRHAEYFLNLKAQAERYLWGAERAVWLERLEADHDNLCAVLERAKRGDHSRLGLQLAVELVQFWYGLGYSRKVLDYLLALLEQDTGDDLLLRARALREAGDLAHALGDVEGARHVYIQHEQMMQQTGNESDPDLLYVQGRLALEAGDYRAARRHFEKALEGMRRLERWEGVFYVLTEIGYAAIQQGDPAGVIPSLEESAAICREHQSLGGEAYALLVLGKALYHLGSQQPDSAPVLKRARECLERSRQIRHTMKHLAGEADALLALGRVSWKEAQYAEAEAQMLEGLRMYRRLGDLSGVEAALDALAQVRGETGRAVSAARFAGAAETIREAQRRQVLPADRPDYDRCISTLRLALGEEAFMAAWETGRAMTWEEAVADALGEDPSARGNAVD